MRALVAETKEHEGAANTSPLACSSGSPSSGNEPAIHIVDLDVAATPLDTDDDGMEEQGAEEWYTVPSNLMKRNKVVMKLKGRLLQPNGSSFVDKTCIVEGDMSGKEVARALPKLSTGGLNDMLASMPQEVISKLIGFAPKIKTIQQMQTNTSSSSCTEGEVVVEYCG